MIKMTKKQAVQYKHRWQAVESAQIRELRSTPISVKFKQLCFLMNSFHWASRDKARDKEVADIRQRWLLLRKRGQA